jgi:3-oxoacyl-[acyl-carrier protein] reductase
MTGGRDLVIVTGTSSGLGQAVARRLTDAGYVVLGVSRRPVAAADVSDSPERYVHVTADLAQIDALPALVGGLVREHGRPYGLVNNAAIGTDGLLATMHNRDIEDLVTLNVVSPLVLTKYVVRQMLSARRGRIINVSSIVASTGYRGLAAYGATKAAMEGMTRSLAREVGPRGVTVNAVAPGFLATEMTTGLGADNLARIRGRSALGRFAEPDEVASTVEFLLSPAAAGLTGTTITVDAGSTA